MIYNVIFEDSLKNRHAKSIIKEIQKLSEITTTKFSFHDEVTKCALERIIKGNFYYPIEDELEVRFLAKQYLNSTVLVPKDGDGVYGIKLK